MPTPFPALSTIDRSVLAVASGLSWVSATARLLAVLAAIAVCTREIEARASCNATVTKFVQITSMKLDAGEQTFEAFRIRPDGLIEQARWNSAGALLGLGALRDPAGRHYEAVLAFASFSRPAAHDAPDDGTLDRPAVGVELATASKMGLRILSMVRMPDDLVALTDGLRRRLVPLTLGPGSYVWTRPYRTGGAVDIDLTRGTCTSGIAGALAEAVASGRLIVGPSDAAGGFVSGERAARMEFVAKIAVGELRFGVVSVK